MHRAKFLTRPGVKYIKINSKYDLNVVCILIEYTLFIKNKCVFTYVALWFHIHVIQAGHLNVHVFDPRSVSNSLVPVVPVIYHSCKR